MRRTGADCANCESEPVARPDQPHETVDGRFRDDCIHNCLADTRREHRCPIDTVGEAINQKRTPTAASGREQPLAHPRSVPYQPLGRRGR